MESHCEELSRSDRPVGICVALSWLLIDVGEPGPLRAVPFPGQVVPGSTGNLDEHVCKQAS